MVVQTSALTSPTLPGAKPERTADLLAFLNELAGLDPQAMGALIEQRVACNSALAEHPSVQVGTFEGTTRVGLLGLLNGFCGTIAEGDWAGWGPISALFDEGGELIGFERTDARSKSTAGDGPSGPGQRIPESRP